MRVKVSLHRPGGHSSDVTLTADATATVGDIADTVARCDPFRGGNPLRGVVTLGIARADAGWVPLARATRFVDGGVRAGAALALLPAPDVGNSPGGAGASVDAPGAGRVAATATIVSGPGAGTRIELPVGTAVIGREPGCDIRLTDPMVSKQHARVTVADVVEVVDLNSSNGILVNGAVCRRAVLGASDVAVFGNTGIQIALHVQTSTAAERARGLAFNRSPVVLQPYLGAVVRAPEPPERPRAGRFPLIPLVAPLVLAAVLLAVTRSPAAILFAALSPVLMVGQWLESRLGGARDYRQGEKDFRAALEQLRADLADRAVHEREQRVREHPSLAETVSAVHAMSPLLWSRRPDAPGFLELRLGLGRGLSRVAVDLPPVQRCDPGLTQELTAVVEAARSIEPVPVVAALRESGALGVAGPVALAAPVAGGLIAQLLGLHSPAEVVLAAVTDADGTRRWSWLRWVPHTASEHSPLTGPHLAGDASSAGGLVSDLEELVTSRSQPATAQPPLPVVVLVVDDAAPVDRARLVWIAEHGPAAGVHVVWVASAVDRLPAACRTYLAVADGGGLVGRVLGGEITRPVQVETLTDAEAAAFAIALAPVVDAGARMDDETDLPRSVSLLTLAGPDLATDAQRVLDRWAESGTLPGTEGAASRRGTLGAVVGQAGKEAFYLDLRTHGPHALVGGTTGSGKSEFLQSWVLGMATTYSPRRVTFLFVDYKGGSAFGECRFLPHCVGLVTDLTPHLFGRTLASLRAELRHREQILERKRAKDLLELERRGDLDAPPSLVIVVDEFAALVSEVPDFVDGMVDVAQRGRSLGIHLILATQRPAGVIKDNLRANTNLRVALRMADESDSTDVLGVPDAGAIEPSLPGRGFAKTGPGRLVPFQAGYVGGWTSTAPQAPSVVIEDLVFGLADRWDEPEPEHRPDPAALGSTDMQRMVATIEKAASAADVQAPRRPWLDPLSPAYRLDLLPTRRTDAELVFGVLDDPRHQEQRPVAFRPDRDGNLAVYGTGGSGKSVLLRTLAVAAGITHRGGPCQVYGLDFATRGLAMLEGLPHVGSVVGGEDRERTARLLRMLRDLIDERAVRYAAANAGTISEYRERDGRPEEPRILLLVDGIAGFRQAHEVPGTGWWEHFLGIATDGRPVGVHVVVSADRVLAVPSALGAVVQRRVVLRMADPEDYRAFGVPVDALSADAPPGRGFIDGDEIQVAVLGGNANVAAQGRAVEEIAEAMRRAGARDAEPIGRLGDRISLADLPAAVERLPVVGVADETLTPLPLDLSGTFLVAGPPSSGRTTALLTISLAALRSGAFDRIVYFGPGRDRNLQLVPWAAVITEPDRFDAAARQLSAELGSGRAPKTLVVLDAAPEVCGGPPDPALQELAKACGRNGHAFLAEGETSALVSSYSPLATTLKTGRAGLLLQPQQSDGETLLKTALPRIARAEFPPGRGVLVARGRSAVIQVALPVDDR